MDGKDVDRLKKLLALGDSPNTGERNNAIAAAGALLKRHGKTMVDLPEILGGGDDAEVLLWQDKFRTAAKLQAHYEGLFNTYRTMSETSRRMHENAIKTAEARGRRLERERLAAEQRDAEHNYDEPTSPAQYYPPPPARAAAQAAAQARTSPWQKKQAQRHEREHRWDAEANRIRLRLRIQEEAAAAGYAPKDTISFVRRGLLVQLKARTDALEDQQAQRKRRRRAA